MEIKQKSQNHDKKNENFKSRKRKKNCYPLIPFVLTFTTQKANAMGKLNFFKTIIKKRFFFPKN